MKFLAILTRAATRTDASTLDTLVIEAPTWQDAKHHALKHFAPCEWKNHEDPNGGAMGAGLIVTQTGEDARPDVELRHAGSAYGEKPNRHVEVRTRKQGKRWTEWRRA